MNFPTIFDWLERFAGVRGLPAVYGLLLLALLVLFIRDWRVSLLALLGQYLLAGLLFVEVLEPRLAFIKVLVGLFVCLNLYVTGRQTQAARRMKGTQAATTTTEATPPLRQARLGPLVITADALFRLFLTAVVLLIVVVLSQRPAYWLPGIAESLSFLQVAIYGLLLLGLLIMSLAGEPLRASMGLLMALLGFDLFYSAQETTLALLVALAAIHLLLTLAVAYLAQVRQRVLHSLNPS